MKAIALFSALVTLPTLLLAGSGPAIPADQRPADRVRADVAQRDDLIEYLVRPGDTAQSIVARGFRNAADWKAAQALNRLPEGGVLKPGSILVLRADWLKTKPITASLAAWRGSVSVRDAKGVRPLAKGMDLREGDLVETAANSFVTMILPDQSRVSLPSSSRIRIARMRHVVLTDSLDRRFRLEQGSSEAKVTPMANKASRFLISTPVAVAAVRGTQYRVTFTPENTVQKTEVTEGKVGVYRPAAGARELLLPAGFGGFMSPSGPQPATALLDAPAIDALPPKRQGKQVQIRLKAAPGAAGYLVELAKDADFVDRIASEEVKTPVAIFDDVEGGHIYVRYSAIDRQGLIGRPGFSSFDRNPDQSVVREENQRETRDQIADLGEDDENSSFEWFAAGSELDDALYAMAMGGDSVADASDGEGGGAAASGGEDDGWFDIGRAAAIGGVGSGGGGAGGGGSGSGGSNSGGSDSGSGSGDSGSGSGSDNDGSGGMVVIPSDPTPPSPVPDEESGGQQGDGNGNGNGKDEPGTGPALVPEPATWLMLIAGFGIIGTLARRRRTVAGR